MCDAFGWCDFLSLTSITANSSVKSEISELLKFEFFVLLFFSYMLSHLFSKKISFHTFFLFTFLHHLLLLPEAVGSQNAAARRARHGHVLPLPRRDGGNKKRKKRSTEDL